MSSIVQETLEPRLPQAAGTHERSRYANKAEESGRCASRCRCWAQAIGRERAVRRISWGIGLWRLRAGAELGEEGEIAPVERQIVYRPLAGCLPDRGIFCLQHGRRVGHLNGFRCGPWLELHVDLHVLRHGYLQVLLGSLGETASCKRHGIVTNSDR